VSWFISLTIQRAFESAENAAQKYASVLEQTPGAIYVCDYQPQIRCVYVSSQIKDILGFDPEEWTRIRDFGDGNSILMTVNG